MRIENSKDLAQVSRERRALLGLTQQELADLAGVSARTIYQLETGESAITFGRLLLVTKTLGLALTLDLATHE